MARHEIAEKEIWLIMEEKNQAQQLKDQLFYKKANALEKMSAEEKAEMRAYAEGYRKFLDTAKIEREAVKAGIAMAEAEGYTEFRFGMKLERGGKYYYNNRGKALYVFAVGTRPLEDGIHITAAHVDSPRLDLKPNPLYENNGICYLKTHYYGGIKKFQWATVPLALHGTVTRRDGSTVDVVIGEDESDPIVYVSDLLIHLSKDQMGRSLADCFPGENLNLIVGTEPMEGTDSDKIKLNVMNLLHEKYGIVEEDLISAELTAVPAAKARYIGLDRSLIGGYGHDDRVCAYTELTGFFADKEHARTAMVILADKEEVGSTGVTGMQSEAFDDLIEEICSQFGANCAQVRAASRCLSADVSAGFDPNFGEAFELRNNSTINGGVVVCKYTGARGKSGTSDATGEFLGWVRSMLNDAGVTWQISELGKVDQGGGGTVAVYIAQKNIDTIDVGVPVLSMHSPYEVISAADLYMTHRAFEAFNKA